MPPGIAPHSEGYGAGPRGEWLLALLRCCGRWRVSYDAPFAPNRRQRVPAGGHELTVDLAVALHAVYLGRDRDLRTAVEASGDERLERAGRRPDPLSAGPGFRGGSVRHQHAAAGQDTRRR